MNELLTQIQDVYAAFSTDVALQIERITRPQALVPAKLRWNWKN